jgi:uncharacterized protein
MAGAAACGSATTATSAPGAPREAAESGLAQVPLTITTATGTHNFVVEVARTPQEQAQGLMYRKSVAADRGMIFPYNPPQQVAFWMKNTLVPLDMVFIGPGGKVVRVVSNAKPLSLEPIPSIDPVSAVLELAGGRAVEIGIKPGDRVSWRG